MHRIVTTLLVFALVATAGCAGSKEAMKAPNPLVGDWTFQIDSPQGPYAGTIALTENEGGSLDGVLTGDTLPGGVEMTNLVFVDNKLTFKFDSGEYGVIDTQVLVTGNAFAGTINVGGVGEMPIRGAKK